MVNFFINRPIVAIVISIIIVIVGIVSILGLPIASTLTSCRPKW